MGEDKSWFMNHSCEPNVWMEESFTLVAKRDINIGEEITSDYSIWESESYISKWECKCGSKNCRKTIIGKDYLKPELQKEYKNHSIPLINKKIEK
ncbi:SET domain-containing protein-lysine N-methyltransferase [Patescibacteria group bacterium]|nr:SET domain-containing protein-lysine N-methyltransferase [Patescibacteria group bacterium]MBU4057678.1 SET domain-containing protein-lysine N-methyltransferase [Patescibacteria group bacterium]MBU4116075.1 SET domain-containing protein-lysine N-methyltransferase [Patescibacteria group bacterium]